MATDPDGCEYPDQPAANCYNPLTPRTLRAHLLEMMRTHFYRPDNLRTWEARQAIGQGWRADESSGILIQTAAHWRPNMTQQRPAILVKTYKWEKDRVVLGNLVRENSLTGEKVYTAMWRGAASCICLAKEESAADVIAEEVTQVLDYSAAELSETLGLFRFEVVELDAAAQVKEQKENYATPVNMGFVLSWNWSTRPDAPRFQKLTDTVRAISSQ